MQRTKIVETEISTATAAGAASSISNATCVRLHNITSLVDKINTLDSLKKLHP